MGTMLICEDCLKGLVNGETLFDAIFLDPPDNLSQAYLEYRDKRTDYEAWLGMLLRAADGRTEGPIWVSHFHRWTAALLGHAVKLVSHDERRLFIWRYTFGQHQQRDCGNGYRPILRLARKGFTWLTDAIREPSARQTKYGDKRADPRGRVPDDVWEFPRVCGTYKERRNWSPNQHPIALMKRIVALSCPPGGTVLDLFGGTMATARACRELGVHCVTYEISRKVCEQAAADLGLIKFTENAWRSPTDVAAHPR